MADNDDDPYFLDFLFNDIVDVHFVGMWIGFGVDFASGAFKGDFEVKVDFPDMSGGTPGFVFTSGSLPSNTKVAAEDLKHTLTTSGGNRLNAFGVQIDNREVVTIIANDGGIETTAFNWGTEVYIHVASPLPTKSFRVSVSGQLTSPPGYYSSSICGFVVGNGHPKAGDSLPLLHPKVRDQASFGGISGLSADFTVDPVKRTVTIA